MTIRSVRWTPEAQALARKPPRDLKKQVRVFLAELATGPLPPRIALPDAYHLVAEEITLIIGGYERVARWADSR